VVAPLALAAIAAAPTAALPQARADYGMGPVRVAFQGELGAYGDQAIEQHWGGHATAAPSASFEHVVADVAWGLADFGVVPVWNTVVGDIASGCDAVRIARSSPYDLTVVGDEHVVIRHQLLARPGAALRDIECVESHPVALAQCGRFLAEHPRIVPREVYDTAGAARTLSKHGAATTAAIAGSVAARRYGLIILAADIQDIPDNVTHFFVIARRNSGSSDLSVAHPARYLRKPNQ